MRFRIHALIVSGFALALAACGATAPPPVVATPAPVVPAGPPPPWGVIAGPLGASLSEADRQIASDAQGEALSKGQRKSWKAKTGTTFGFVEPGAESGSCRKYTHTIYIDGRPKSEEGQGCRQADGSWRA
jgi:surface antigen